MQASIVIPVLNEGHHLHDLLGSLQTFRQTGNQIILVDGGSRDKNLKNIGQLIDKFATTAPGRAMQMNEGARIADHELLLFLHADNRLSNESLDDMFKQLARSNKVWGRFDVKLSGKHWLYRVIETAMNLRSRVTGIATGDQAIFVQRRVFEKIHGYAAIDIMEDIELSARLKKISRPVCLQSKVVTSSRKWQRNGIIKTMMMMWSLRLAYFLGVSPKRLHTIYYSSPER